MIVIDTRQAVNDVKRSFPSATPNNVALAIARALNHTAAKAKTASIKEIRGRWKTKAADLRKAIVVSKASRASQTALVVYSGRPMPVRYFAARQTKEGVSVNILGTRKTIKGAFIATMKSGYRGVFARGYYTNKFNFRTKRVTKSGNDVPIASITTRSIPGQLVENSVLTNVSAYINREFPNRMKYELTRITSKK